jgi:2'-5' RNA ligase
VPEALQTLHEALADALRRAGLPVESRPLRPHVTLARHAAHAEFPAEPLDVVWRVEGYALVESRLATGEYRVVERYAASHSLRANSSSSR